MRKILATLLALVMMLGLMVPSAWAAAGDEYAGKTVILHSNDVHGAIAGYAKMAALKAEYEAEGAEVILADAGDYSQGTTYVSTTKGKDAIDMMNAVGYDVATLGNHEFDYGWAQLKENMAAADFQVLCADVLDGSETIFDGHTIIEKGGVKVGFFGLETPEAQTKANPALIQGLTFLAEDDMYTCAQAQVDALKTEGADVIICLSHLGVDAESKPNRSYDMLKNVSGIDMVIDGHSHTVMTEGENGEAIQSTGTAFANIGVIVIDNTSKKIESNNLVDCGEYTAEDKTVADAAKVIIDRVMAEYGQKFATSEVALNGAKAPNGNRDSETNMGDLITDSMMWAVTKDEGSITAPAENIVAITNGGGIRAPIAVGDVTKNDVNTVLPFGNTVAVVYVTGAELLEALEASTYCTPTSVGGFPQVAGINFTLEINNPYNANDDTYPGSTYYGPKTIERVTINSINGKDFDSDATYAVVTNNFCAAGGDTYYAFAAATSQFDTGLPLDEVLMNYITEELGGVIGEEYAAPQGRITITECKHGNGTKLANEKAATCLEEGYTGDEVCAICGKVMKSGEAIPTVDHNFGEWTVTTPATCGAAGVETRICSVGQEEETREIPATGNHSFKDGVCTVCGAADPNYTPVNPTDKTEEVSPATGDTGVVVYAALAMMAAFGTAVVAGKKKEWF